MLLRATTANGINGITAIQPSPMTRTTSQNGSSHLRHHSRGRGDWWWWAHTRLSGSTSTRRSGVCVSKGDVVAAATVEEGEVCVLCLGVLGEFFFRHFLGGSILRRSSLGSRFARSSRPFELPPLFPFFFLCRPLFSPRSQPSMG